MNKVLLMGRLTRDPEVRHSTGSNPIAIARYTLAVDRWTKEGNSADFIPCKAFEKKAEFAEKFLFKGTKIVVVGRIQTDSHTNAEGKNARGFEVIVEECEFAESKSSGGSSPSQERNRQEAGSMGGGFMNIPDGIDGELPFH